MSLQALPRRVASPPELTPVPKSACPASDPPRLWPDLPAEARMRIARTLADLMRRMRAADGAPGREAGCADRDEHG